MSFRRSHSPAKVRRSETSNSRYASVERQSAAGPPVSWNNLNIFGKYRWGQANAPGAGLSGCEQAPPNEQAVGAGHGLPRAFRAPPLAERAAGAS